MRALGVASAKRSPFAPDLPTIAEQVAPGYEANQWFGLLAPRGTPTAIVDQLQKAVATSLGAPEVNRLFATEGAEPVADSPTEFAALISAEMDKWSSVGRTAHLAPE